MFAWLIAFGGETKEKKVIKKKIVVLPPRYPTDEEVLNNKRNLYNRRSDFLGDD